MMYTLLNGQVAHSVKAAKNADTVPESTGIYGVCTAADLTAALRSFLLANLEPPFQSLLPPSAAYGMCAIQHCDDNSLKLEEEKKICLPVAMSV